MNRIRYFQQQIRVFLDGIPYGRTTYMLAYTVGVVLCVLVELLIQKASRRRSTAWQA